MRRTLQLLLFGLLPVLLPLPARAQVADTKPPVIHHTPVSSVTTGDTVSITAQIIDESEVFGATLWYRAVGASTYASVELTRKGDLWGAAIPVNGETQYWLEAYDEFGNGPTRSGTPDKPYTIHVTAPAPLYAPREAKPASAPTVFEPGAAPASAAKEEPPAAKVEPPAPKAEPAPAPKAQPAPEPAPAPKAEEAAAPAPAPRTEDKGTSASSSIVEPPHSDSAAESDDLGEADHFQIKSAQPPPGSTAFAAPVEKGPPPGPAYQQWWFITGVTVVGVAAITTAVYFLYPRPVYRNVFDATVQP